MTEERLSKLIKAGAGLSPHRDFVERSRRLILTTPVNRSPLALLRHELAQNMKFAFALSLASVIAFTVFGGFTYLRQGKLRPAAPDLVREANNLDFQIRIGELKHFDDSAREIAGVLGEIRKSENGGTIEDVLNEITL